MLMWFVSISTCEHRTTADFDACPPWLKHVEPARFLFFQPCLSPLRLRVDSGFGAGWRSAQRTTGVRCRIGGCEQRMFQLRRTTSKSWQKRGMTSVKNLNQKVVRESRALEMEWCRKTNVHERRPVKASRGPRSRHKGEVG